LAKQSNAKIKYVFETHFHADFISGHLTLAKSTGASIVYGPRADPEFEAIIAEDNQVFKIGNVSLTVIHTPGHTLESTSFLLKDESGKEHSIFTGDTLFLGDVGIPDVAQRYKGITKEELAGTIYDSVNNRIKPLPEDIFVYPGHGAGSACGKNMMKETIDTLANQKKINYALNGTFSRNNFIKELTDDLPEPPAYFPSNVKLNQQGYLDLDEIIKNCSKPLNVDEFKTLSKNSDTIVLDVRHQDNFKDGYVPNSIFIGLAGGFAPWVGSVLKKVEQNILLVCENGQENEAITRLSRVGFDNVVGYLKGGFNNWKNSGEEIEKIESIKANDLEVIIENNISLIDVRACGERKNGLLDNSLGMPLNNIDNEYKSLEKSTKHYIHCAGGYRSMIACSLLKKEGYNSVIDIQGGFAAISKNTNLNITIEN
jgi:glyoxylase-like metal-dependent hydrolase (beta-lactamase superfamily II)/rhodanese-related sulfurtransferase